MSDVPRILHVIDPGGRDVDACTLRLMVACTDPDDAIMLIGRGGEAGTDLLDGAAAPRVHVAPAAWWPSGASVRRALRRAEEDAARFDAVHAWTSRSLGWAAATGRRFGGSLGVAPAPGLDVWCVRRALRRGPVAIIAGNPVVERLWRTRRLDPALLSMAPAAVDPNGIESLERSEARRRWQAGSDELVIALLTTPTDLGDAWAATGVACRLAASGRPVRLVTHPRAWRRTEARRWADRIGHGHIVVPDEWTEQPWRIAAGFDAGLMLAAGGSDATTGVVGALPALWMMAAGVPVLADGAHVAAIDPGRERVCVVVDGARTNEICRALLGAVGDDALISAARRRATERHAIEPYRRRVRGLYEQARS